MTEEMTVAQAEKNLAAVQAECAELDAQVGQVLQQIESLKQRENELRGVLRGYICNNGKIHQAKAALKVAKLTENDKSLPEPIWVKAPYMRERHVISRVTAKRIYLRVLGDDFEIYFSKETGRSLYDGLINVEATIARWDEYSVKSKVVAG